MSILFFQLNVFICVSCVRDWSELLKAASDAVLENLLEVKEMKMTQVEASQGPQESQIKSTEVVATTSFEGNNNNHEA